MYLFKKNEDVYIYRLQFIRSIKKLNEELKKYSCQENKLQELKNDGFNLRDEN